MSPSTITYFGYGSLVNRDTRPADEPSVRARLRGWRRAWEHRAVGLEGWTGSCSLTVERVDDPEAMLDGVLVNMPVDDLPLLDAREYGYERVLVPAEHVQYLDASGPVIVESSGTRSSIMIYRSLRDNLHPACQEHPILQSYVDCVLEGYRVMFGEEGLYQFMQTTRGWQGPRLDDRASPRYPRAVKLSSLRLAEFDELIARHA